ncbi:MAG: hypothetical protein JWQ27_1184 [Ferruginibacter sp.]|nr:hypothetical protein [Ferruginibacter sp.]
MKKLGRQTFFLSFLFASATTALAQDSTVTGVLTNDEALWYMQPWVWIAGGIAILLILIALFSKSGSKNKATSRTDKVIITKTIRTETDVDD